MTVNPNNLTGHGHASSIEQECCLTCSPAVECPRCGGRGETPVPGTYGPTTSPEALDLVRCWLCRGAGEVSPDQARRYTDTPEEP